MTTQVTRRSHRPAPHAGVADDADGHAGAEAGKTASQTAGKVCVAVKVVVRLVCCLVDCRAAVGVCRVA